MTGTRIFALTLAGLVLAVMGCGSSPRTVTKSQYEVQLAASGQAIKVAGQELGKSLAAADLDSGVSGLQKALRDSEKKLTGLVPPANARAANKHLAHALGDLADALESVKAADTMPKARLALGRVGRSAAIKEGQAALRELNRLGYEGGAAGP